MFSAAAEEASSAAFARAFDEENETRLTNGTGGPEVLNRGKARGGPPDQQEGDYALTPLHLAIRAHADDARRRRYATGAALTPSSPVRGRLIGSPWGRGGPLTAISEASPAYELLAGAPQAVRDLWRASFDGKKLRRR